MNTVKIGDDFEKKSKQILKRIIDNHELSSIPAHCTIREKAKYQSYKRSGKNIIFDIAIEVKNPNAKKPILVYIVECKNLKSPVPVDDIEEFNDKVGGILGVQTKKIMIAKSGFQSGVMEVADNLGVMLVEVKEDDYEIILHKSEKTKKVDSSKDIDKEILTLIGKAYFPKEIKGLKKLSADQINDIAVSFLNDFDQTVTKKILPVPINKLVKYLEETKFLKINSKNNLTDNSGNELLGYYDLKNKTIFINAAIKNTIRFPFILAHEIGHFVLHSNLKTNQFVYDNFKDSEYSLFIQKHKLRNDKNWLEWQANCFASCLLMPKQAMITKLIAIQIDKGISKQGRIYLDEQRVNQKDFIDIVEKLALFFGVSKTSVEYRLESLNIIQRPPLSKKDERDKETLRALSLLNEKVGNLI
ncbi:ImmA/IrrE family metallo-endopeptidase [Muricauda sp. SK9]|uniref:ImmA/IrrE family metallo-endopeptidase n=1 Tax=Flavobacteriaceae TaxID=49546 RepID=UPI0011C3F6FE|nr:MULTISPECIES: ImmA/IrrE family metallo-endopeptidase [Allomuricauda]MDC6383990.1 ImmA/IrrE family metallo-endopeptidase [Muricauda sp. SK9]